MKVMRVGLEEAERTDIETITRFLQFDDLEKQFKAKKQSDAQSKR